MSDGYDQRGSGLNLRFTIRSLLVLTTLVAAFFGGRASMGPDIEAERLRAKVAEQDLRALRQQVDTRPAQFIQQFTLPRPIQDMRSIDRAEQQNLKELQQRIDKAMNREGL